MASLLREEDKENIWHIDRRFAVSVAKNPAQDNDEAQKKAAHIDHVWSQWSNSSFARNPPMTRQIYRSLLAADSSGLVEMVLLSTGNSCLEFSIDDIK